VVELKHGGNEMRVQLKGGVEIEVGGPFRPVCISGEWFVTGKGILFPCEDREEAHSKSNELRREVERRIKNGGINHE
jgi:hypothetical protein